MNRRYRIQLLTLPVLLLSFLVFGTYAWHASKSQTSADGITFNIENKNVTLTDYKVYRYDENGNMPMDQKIILQPYDTIFTERNNNLAVILSMEISGVSAGDTFTVTLTSDDKPSGTTSVNLSDVIYAQAAMLNVSAESNKSIYAEVYNDFNASGAPAGQQFDQVNGTTVTRGTSVSFTVTMAADSKLYIFLNYSSDLIAASGVSSIQFGAASTSISYAGDLKELTIS